MADFFPEFFFLLRPSSGGNGVGGGSKLDQKHKLWVRPISLIIQISANMICLVKFSEKSDEICGSKGPEETLKG